jgi:tRNA(adenine34) deaminase
MLSVLSDSFFMQEALKEAQKAFHSDEVPVGAVVVCGNRIIARAHNQTEKLQDSSAHAEMLAITAASAAMGSKWLEECALFVTLEPCVMCAGAICWSRVGRLVYGASDDKRGFMRYGKELLHPTTKVEFGILYEECGALLSTFFTQKRII